MQKTVSMILKMVLTLLGGTALGGGVVAVVGQKDKDKLRQEARRAHDMAERAVKDAESLKEELDKRK